MLNKLSKKLIFPLYWKHRKLRVKQYLNYFMANQWQTPEQLYEKQWFLLKRLLIHAYRKVPFYRRRFDEIGFHPNDMKSMNDFRKIPYLTKVDISENEGDLIASNFGSNDLIKDSTGGSTGKRITFYEDRDELSNRFASTIRGDSWAGLSIGDKYAQIWGSPLDLKKASRLRQLIDSVLIRRLFISSFNMSEVDIKKAIRKIKKFKPKVLIGYPTSLHLFSKYISRYGIQNLGIESIISSGETLYDYQRKQIENEFKCKVFNRYGCREFGAIASECQFHQGLHVLIDRFVIEFAKLEESEKRDNYYEIVLTDLNKYGMPFIRYKIGDICIPRLNSCVCGRGLPILERIEGRSFDLIIGTNSNFVGGTFWTLLFGSVRGIDMFQIIQKKADVLNVTLSTTKNFNKNKLAFLEKKIKEKCGDQMNIFFDFRTNIAPYSSGKYRFIISEIAKEYFSK